MLAARARKQGALHGEIDQLGKGIPARRIHALDERLYKLRADAARFDEHLFPFLHTHGIVDQHLRQFIQPGITHTGTSLPRRGAPFFYEYYTAESKKYKAIANIFLNWIAFWRGLVYNSLWKKSFSEEKTMPLVTSTEMFKKAYAGGYAIGAFNVNNMETIQGIVEAGKECNSPLILQVSAGARKYANPVYLKHLVEAAVETTGLPIVLHLDHGADFEACKSAVDDGFTSVMIDASHHSFKENIEITKKVVAYAHDRGVVVEAELGQLAGIEDAVNVKAEDASFTQPDEVYEFTTKTGCDSLAIAIGTSHGAYKFKPGQKPQLRFDILEEVGKRLPGFPIVLHGASSVPQDRVAIINQFGGKMPDAIGIPEDMLRKAASMAVCKINIDSDLRVACTAAIRKHMFEHPDHFDPRQYLGDARAAVKEIVRHKIVDVLGSNDKA